MDLSKQRQHQIDELKAEIEGRKLRKRNRVNIYARKKRLDPEWAAERNEWSKKYRAQPSIRAKHNSYHRREDVKERNRLRYAAKRDENAPRPRPTHCEVCGYQRKIYFDHCHETKAFRGWLCHSCNIIIGHVNDDPIILEKLAAYIRRFKDDGEHHSLTQSE